MTVRAVEWKKPYTGWKAIEITEDKVINLRLRDENNLIIWDEWDNEIYVDLQLDDEITPTDAFPVWITTGRVIVDNWWDLTGTIICAKTTSGDNIKLLYADEWTLWIDNWTWTFKQIYFKSDVDTLLANLREYIDEQLALKADKSDTYTKTETDALLEDKADVIDTNAKVFYLTWWQWDQDIAQEIVDWFRDGKLPIVCYGSCTYTLSDIWSASGYPMLVFTFIDFLNFASWGNSYDTAQYLNIRIAYDNTTWTLIHCRWPNRFATALRYLNPLHNYPSPYTPLYDWSPATKKYVDDNVGASVDSTAPTSPYTGQLWYDTANSTLNIYDWTQWQTV